TDEITAGIQGVDLGLSFATSVVYSADGNILYAGLASSSNDEYATQFLKIDLANDYAIDDSIAVTGGVKALARDSSGNIWVGKGSSSGAGYLAILDTALDTFTPVPTVTDYVMHILPKDDVMLVSWNYGYEHNLFDLTGAD